MGVTHAPHVTDTDNCLFYILRNIKAKLHMTVLPNVHFAQMHIYFLYIEKPMEYKKYVLSGAWCIFV